MHYKHLTYVIVLHLFSCTSEALFDSWTEFNRKMREEVFGKRSLPIQPQEEKNVVQDPENLIMLSDIKGSIPQEIYDLRDYISGAPHLQTLGIQLPKGILLVGPPGTGKTMIARALANELNIPFIYASASTFIEIYVGVGAKRVRDLFEKARDEMKKKQAKHVIIFIDELDAIGNRNRFNGSGEEEKTIDELLTQMDGFDKDNHITVIAATNRIENIDSALKRPGRFDEIITIPLPDTKARREILEYYLYNPKFNRMVEGSINLESLIQKSHNWSGAELESVIKKASLIAGRARRVAITQQDLDAAFAHVRTMHQERA